MRIRAYGSAGPVVVLLHGGPGAGGELAPVARALADTFRVLEPLQRGSGGAPLTVARHVADLHHVVVTGGRGAPVAVVGHSWGAMLALAYAAAHPAQVRSLALVGCGTFDRVSRERLRITREARLDDEARRALARAAEIADPDLRLRALGGVYARVDSYELVSTGDDHEICDARAHDETWADMLRLQEQGVYPAAFTAIEAPVLMLHGAQDPHPGMLLRASLAPFLPRLDYRELPRCGHYPWREKAAREDFFGMLRAWLRA